MAATTSEYDRERLFLSSPHFAVFGASKDQNKWGTKVLKWYQAHDKSVTPVHPSEPVLEGIPTVRSLDQLPDPSKTSVSIITPARITLGILEQAKALDVPAIWIQPGAEDESVRAYIRDNGLADRVILGGACVLVDGPGVLRSLL